MSSPWPAANYTASAWHPSFSRTSALDAGQAKRTLGVGLKKKDAHAQEQWLTPVIPVTREAEIRRISVQGQARQKVRPPSQQISQVWGFTVVIQAIWEIQVEGSKV
jgi:hypothetical protein